ncbi:MAG: endopeptidase La [Verrucomicrobia bacterium]|nr:endopeptidase La [Verrucomicrobiota bacterium]MCF7707359.1 endopeptidase La [Verrucomicrobiota bacterium]
MDSQKNIGPVFDSSEAQLVDILDGSASERGDKKSKSDTESFPSTLPILGLSDIVLFPGMVAPLLVESSSGMRLIDDAVTGNRLIALVLQHNQDTEDPAPEDLHSFGCAGRVLKMLKFPDNTVRVLVEGLHRIKIKKYVQRTPYPKAEIEVIEDVTGESVEIDALTRNVKKFFEEIIQHSPALADQVKVAYLNIDESGKLTDLIASTVNLQLSDRQQLLETPSVKDRLSHLLPLLNREAQVVSLGTKIQKDVADSMSKTQRDFFLREQIRAIQRELGESDAASAEVERFRKLIDQNNLPEEPRRVALREIDRMEQIPPTVPEYTVVQNYLDWIVNLPWNKSTPDKVDLQETEKILNDQHYGLTKVKDRLLEFIAVIKLKRNLKGPILCLVGPPGVGKTSLGRSIADAIGRKFARFSLGGMRDEAEIRGHRRTYVGALPGRIIQCLRRTESNNPVILLDELDKVGSDFRGDPASALLEVLDPQQNSTFTDHYLDMPFDLSRVLFITTANWLDPVHPALRDRLEVIELPSYTEEEKLQICKRYLVPRQLSEHGLNKRQVRFHDKALRHVIKDYTREAGVRQLEREVAGLARKAARRIAGDGDNVPQPYVVKADRIPALLGPPRFITETAEAITEHGIATGLAWTPVGGDILFIEATSMSGSGRLILTGSLGDVMKESAQTALSYLRSQAERIGIDMTQHNKQDVHIHVPAGATPKDGPSAGLTIAVALASLFTKRLIKSDVGMTGEISLRGRVLPVGGVKEKVLAASRSGLKQVILPAQNKKDYNDIPSEIRSKTRLHFISHISEALPIALKKKPRS